MPASDDSASALIVHPSDLPDDDASIQASEQIETLEAALEFSNWLYNVEVSPPNSFSNLMSITPLGDNMRDRVEKACQRYKQAKRSGTEREQLMQLQSDARDTYVMAVKRSIEVRKNRRQIWSLKSELKAAHAALGRQDQDESTRLENVEVALSKISEPYAKAIKIRRAINQVQKEFYNCMIEFLEGFYIPSQKARLKGLKGQSASAEMTPAKPTSGKTRLPFTLDPMHDALRRVDYYRVKNTDRLDLPPFWNKVFGNAGDHSVATLKYTHPITEVEEIIQYKWPTIDCFWVINRSLAEYMHQLLNNGEYCRRLLRMSDGQDSSASDSLDSSGHHADQGSTKRFGFKDLNKNVKRAFTFLASRKDERGGEDHKKSTEDLEKVYKDGLSIINAVVQNLKPSEQPDLPQTRKECKEASENLKAKVNRCAFLIRVFADEGFLRDVIVVPHPLKAIGNHLAHKDYQPDDNESWEATMTSIGTKWMPNEVQDRSKKLKTIDHILKLLTNQRPDDVQELYHQYVVHYTITSNPNAGEFQSLGAESSKVTSLPGSEHLASSTRYSHAEHVPCASQSTADNDGGNGGGSGRGKAKQGKGGGKGKGKGKATM